MNTPSGPFITEELDDTEHTDVHGKPFFMPNSAIIPLETHEERSLYWQQKAAYADWRHEQLEAAVCDVLGEKKRERVLNRATEFEGACPLPDGYHEGEKRLCALVEARVGRKLRRER